MAFELCWCGHERGEHVEESGECRHDAEERQGCSCRKFEYTPQVCGGIRGDQLEDREILAELRRELDSPFPPKNSGEQACEPGGRL